jgi:hypothetical protein
MFLENRPMGPKPWRKALRDGGHVVTCSHQDTGFFTLCESGSRLTVSIVKHTEGLDVFA